MKKKLKQYIVSAILTLFLLPISAQKSKEIDADDWGEYIYQSVHFHTDSTKIVANILAEKKEIKPNLDDYYYTVINRKVYKTRGGYTGKLLHGEYMEQYITGELLTKGTFFLGRKDGVWKVWFPNGELKEVITWKKGGKDGEFREYNNIGELLEKGKFHNGSMNVKKKKKKWDLFKKKVVEGKNKNEKNEYNR